MLPRFEKAIGEKEFAEALKAADQGFLASRYDQLVTALERLAAAGSKSVKPADAEKLRALLDSRKAADEEGAKAATATTKDLAAKFRKAHPPWFEGIRGE